ncbi:hypothetical protein [Spirosoma pollinicola]|uniref:Outer membrane protein beta-barrel domain-containing protein n=1 Tax=Spirosoma pollinicola TaxID=2057025 RepID=A0A2K8ZCE6_9BACT|nr:hypothetical protein [Spirosoma pollinicola]AUD07548.1 hypothetical protein CWM47_29570 [Spirosoma pollinicola]
MKRLFLVITSVFFFAGVQAQSTMQRSAYVNYTEFGGLFGRVASGPAAAQTVENRLSFTAQTFNGIQLNSQLAVGGLVGVDWYKTALLMPIGAGLRVDLIPHPQQNVRLLAIADAGYGFAWFNKNSTGYETKGGWMLNPGLALRVGKPSSTAFVMSLSYKRQIADVQKPLAGNDIERDEHRVYNRICFRIGVAF